MACLDIENEAHHKKSCLWGFQPGPHNLGCTVTEDDKRLRMKDLGSRGIVLNKSANQLQGYRACQFAFA